ncbi:DUF4271 domain-containing protein [Marinilabilia sp.]|uniref:DUF4271 domain-containing protein n=1 Tax=Marinilabilia sp. TaxID=2021252 RepID=UPI0025BDE9AE|nr:DUF4271 domain-containing protein [Marinilabilia sp.]
MKPNAIPESQEISQNNDTTALILQPVIDVPESIEIKVERPAIQLLKEEEPQERRRQESVEQVMVETPETPVPEAEPDMVYEGPDGLESVLIAEWQSSGYTSDLWSSNFNAEISILPLDYFSDGFGKSNSVSEKQADFAGTFEDSLQAVVDSSVFVEKAVKTIETVEIQDPIPVNVKEHQEPLLGQNWFLVLIVSLVALTGFIRFKWYKYISDVFSAVLFKNVAGKLQSTNSGVQKVASFWLEFLFYANFALLFFESMRQSGHTFFQLSGWKLLVPLFGFLIVIFTLKFIVYRFIGWVFGVQEATAEYLFQSSIMSKAFGLILLPLVVIFPFLEPEARHWIPRIGFSVFVILYVIQVGRGFVANLRGGLSGYYIFLYLCALEILPLSILIKVLFY